MQAADSAFPIPDAGLKDPAIVLLDNGSSRADSTLALRRLAAALAGRIGKPVHPVSLLHANKVPAERLDGRSADTFEPFLRARAAAGDRAFLVLPLFFGHSGALTGFIPDKVAEIGAELGPLDVRIADVLCPLPDGEPRLAEILRDNLRQSAGAAGITPRRVILVDHGSPLPQVTAVRRHLAGRLRAILGTEPTLEEAVMERRPGAAYDFNGDLLEDVLRRAAAETPQQAVMLSLLFLSAGRHAGPGGDIDQICAGVTADFPGLRVLRTGLVGSHPLLLDILGSRYEAAMQDRPVSGKPVDHDPAAT
jgi:sirohydrochlorin ferrochelatase